MKRTSITTLPKMACRVGGAESKSPAWRVQAIDGWEAQAELNWEKESRLYSDLRSAVAQLQFKVTPGGRPRCPFQQVVGGFNPLAGIMSLPSSASISAV